MKFKKTKKIILVIMAICLAVGICCLILLNLNPEIEFTKIRVQRDKSLDALKEIIDSKSISNRESGNVSAKASKIIKSSDMINELAIGHTLLLESNQSVNSYTNKNIVFDIAISEINYETETDIDTLINSISESVGAENAQSVIDAINNGEIYSLEGFPNLKKFKIIMKDAYSGNILKQVDLSSEIKNNALATQLTVEQNCIIEVEGMITCKIEFYNSQGNKNMECSWDDTYTSENFLIINQIDKILPTITITPNGSGTSQSQNITIIAEDNGGSGLSSNNSYQYQLGTSNTEVPKGTWRDYTNKKQFTIGEGLTGNYYIWVKNISDNAGNNSSQTGYIVSKQYIFDNRIKDTTEPTINSVSGNATAWTNENVTLTINATDNESGIAGYSFDNGENWQTSNSKIFTENTNGIIVKVKDNENNVATYEQTINIDKIDKTSPTMTITPNGSDTSKSKEVTITIADTGGSGLNSENSYQYKLGKSSTEVPTGNWEDYTNGTKFTIGEGLTGDYYIWVKAIVDNAGNKVTESDYIVSSKFIFDNSEEIDRIPPELRVEYSTTQLTKESVTVTIKSNEEIKEIDTWTISADNKILTKVYTKNTTENIDIYDLAGNKTTIQVKITNIDKTEIKATVEYSTTILTNKNVIVKIISNKEVKEISGWTLLEDKKTLTKEYTENYIEDVKLQDLFGNERKIKISVQNIDKTLPNVEVKYSTTENTKEDVIVTIVSNEQLKEIDGWKISENGKKLTKKYDKNVEETIKIYDIAGNELEVQISVKNIDKTTTQKPEVEDTQDSKKPEVEDTQDSKKPEVEDIQNSEKTEVENTQNSEELDTAPMRIPDTGTNTLIGGIIITIIVTIVLWIKNRKYKDI